MRIKGYDGASSPSVSLEDWREKLAGKSEHLRPEKLPVFVSQAYQDLDLIRSDSSFMIDGTIETTKYSLPSDAMAATEEHNTKFVGLMFDGIELVQKKQRKTQVGSNFDAQQKSSNGQPWSCQCEESLG
jgi:hypothetical protein